VHIKLRLLALVYLHVLALFEGSGLLEILSPLSVTRTVWSDLPAGRLKFIEILCGHYFDQVTRID